MKFRIADCVQRGHHFAIVDEVDSILIDEARTPLIISGPSEESTDKYYKINRIIPSLIRGEVIEGKEPGQKWTTGDYTVDEKHRSVALTEEGSLKIERLLGLGNLYEAVNMEINHHVQQGLKAHVLFHRDNDYVVKDDEVHHRRRIHRPPDAGPPLVRWSAPGGRSQGRRQDPARESDAGHHHLPELFPHVQEAGRHDRHGRHGSRRVRQDLQAGSHRRSPPTGICCALDYQDVVYRTEEEKFRNAAKEIKELHDKGQPVLVGTVSVEKSEKLSSF